MPTIPLGKSCILNIAGIRMYYKKCKKKGFFKNIIPGVAKAKFKKK